MALALNRTVSLPQRQPAIPQRMASSRLSMRAMPSIQQATETLALAAVESAGSSDLSKQQVKQQVAAATLRANVDSLEPLQAVLSASLEAQMSSMEAQRVSTEYLKVSTEALLVLRDSVLSMQNKLRVMERAAVQQTLLTAWDHSAVGEFKYYNGTTPVKSGALVKQVLEAFMQGYGGMWISDAYYVSPTPSGADDAGRARFREQLSIQIHRLTGVMPRLQEEVNANKQRQWAIKRK